MTKQYANNIHFPSTNSFFASWTNANLKLATTSMWWSMRRMCQEMSVDVAMGLVGRMVLDLVVREAIVESETDLEGVMGVDCCWHSHTYIYSNEKIHTVNYSLILYFFWWIKLFYLYCPQTNIFMWILQYLFIIFIYSLLFYCYWTEMSNNYYHTSRSVESNGGNNATISGGLQEVNSTSSLNNRSAAFSNMI